MKTSTMLGQVRSRLGEDSPDFWSDSEIIDALNEAQRRFNVEEKWHWLYASASTVLLNHTDTLRLQAGVEFTRHQNFMLKSPQLAYPILPKRVTPAEGFAARRRFFVPGFVGFPRWYYLEQNIIDPESSTGRNEIQSVSLVNRPTAGTWKLRLEGFPGLPPSFSTGGFDTGPLAFNISGDDLATAINDAYTAASHPSPAVTVTRTGDGFIRPYTYQVEWSEDPYAMSLRPLMGAFSLDLVPATIPGPEGQNIFVDEVQEGYDAGSGEEGEQEIQPVVRFIPRANLDFDVEYQFLMQAPDLAYDPDADPVVDVEPLVPEDYQGALVAYATGQLWLKELNGGTKSVEQMTLYKMILGQAQAELKNQAIDDVIAWGKEDPELVGRQVLEDWVFGRIPPSVGA